MSAEENVDAGGLHWVRIPATGDARREPLIILHGLFGSADNWRTQGRALADNRDVHIPDMPNHGASRHTDRVGYRDLASDLWDALGAAGIDGPVVILGHSMGGKAAMAMSFAQPERTAALVIADIAPRVYPPRHTEILEAMHAVADSRVRSRGEADRIMAPHIPEKAVRLFLLKSLVPVRDGDGTEPRYVWQLNLPGLATGYTTISDWPFTDETFDGPVHVIAGGASPYITTDDYPRIHHHFPNARIDVMPGVGHWLHAEARDAFLAIVETTVQ